VSSQFPLTSNSYQPQSVNQELQEFVSTKTSGPPNGQAEPETIKPSNCFAEEVVVFPLSYDQGKSVTGSTVTKTNTEDYYSSSSCLAESENWVLEFSQGHLQVFIFIFYISIQAQAYFVGIAK